MADLSGTCDCGAVTINVPHPPRRLTDCPCDFCTRTGVLWAYYPKDTVTVEGPTHSYARARRRLLFHRCTTCGIVTHWSPETVDWKNAGVNMRNFAPDALRDIPAGPPQ